MRTKVLRTTKLKDGGESRKWVRGWPSTLLWIVLNKRNYLGCTGCQVLIPTIISLGALRARESTSWEGEQPVVMSTGLFVWKQSPLFLFCAHKPLTVLK